MTTPTSRRRDVRASTATAPAADEERGARLSSVLAKKRENGCRLLLLRYTSDGQPPSNHLGLARSSSRAYFRHEANSLPQPHAVTIPPRSLPFSRPLASSLSLPYRHLHPPCSLALRLPRRLYETPPFTIAATALPPGFQLPTPPLKPLTLRGEHPPARVTSQQRSPRPRPRAETNRELSALRQSAIRLAATPRHAARSVCFSASRFKSLRA